eukprot:scaffold68315_cov68-Phaeocystis_antarctica.AAC.3
MAAESRDVLLGASSAPSCVESAPFAPGCAERLRIYANRVKYSRACAPATAPHQPKASRCRPCACLWPRRRHRLLRLLPRLVCVPAGVGDHRGRLSTRQRRREVLGVRRAGQRADALRAAGDHGDRPRPGLLQLLPSVDQPRRRGRRRAVRCRAPAARARPGRRCRARPRGGGARVSAPHRPLRRAARAADAARQEVPGAGAEAKARGVYAAGRSRPRSRSRRNEPARACGGPARVATAPGSRDRARGPRRRKHLMQRQSRDTAAPARKGAPGRRPPPARAGGPSRPTCLLARWRHGHRR